MLVDYSDDEQEIMDNKPKSILVNPEVDCSHLVKKKEEEKALELSKTYNFLGQKKNHLTGNVESVYYNDAVFEEQFHKFNVYGFAVDPNERNRRVIACNQKQEELSTLMKEGYDVDAADPLFSKNVLAGMHKEDKLKQQELKQNRVKANDPSKGEFMGPWAGQQDEQFENIQMNEEQQKLLDQLEEQRKQKIDESKKQEENFVPYMEQHVSQTEQFGGRQFIAPPPELKYVDHTCYIPKRCIQTFHGHTKGVQVCKFFPKFGHLMLSGSLDHKIKMWDIIGNKQCVRTYYGHQGALRDLNFSNDGRTFLSAGYDKKILVWDTEYGKVTQTINLQHFPYCVRLNPDPAKQHSFLLGSSDKRIKQFDIRSGQQTLVYDEHLQAINTITYFNQNRKFVSSSDDKKLFIWEFGIPVVIKHISDPEMHAVTATAVNPSGLNWVGQQSNNLIIVYDTKAGNFRMNRKKNFKGHVSAGYACGVTFSADGQFLASGDSEGRVFFWDWKTAKSYRTIQAHDNVCIGVEWHPIEPSKVVTCGWDGVLKLWD
ncbi:unnamed protein product [Paramecium pentaurelia]|uniref:Pre-mRNA-processing factor 17 n=1 Tax=Paramecium pentaurelia TaxID=43138 RepID=A0A8S1V1I4_9CILI|nr:unnamed protein product [Paramecium pentaurelia]